MRIPQCCFFVSRISIGAESQRDRTLFATANPSCGGSILLHQNAKRSFVESEFYRTIADPFAVDFDRHGLIALHSDPARLEIFNLLHANVGTKYYVLQIFDDLEITEPFEDDDVQKAIVDHGVFKKWKW